MLIKFSPWLRFQPKSKVVYFTLVFTYIYTLIFNYAVFIVRLRIKGHGVCLFLLKMEYFDTSIWSLIHHNIALLVYIFIKEYISKA
jgi:hypothetical protein